MKRLSYILFFYQEICPYVVTGIKKLSNKLCSYCLIIFKCTVHKRSTNLNFKYKIGQIFVCPLFHCAPAISHICHTTATSEQQLISISYISLPWLLRFFQSIEPKQFTPSNPLFHSLVQKIAPLCFSPNTVSQQLELQQLLKYLLLVAQLGLGCE